MSILYFPSLYTVREQLVNNRGDAVELSGDFAVWLASQEAAFLNGRYVWANWDVDELKAKAGEIQAGQQLTAGILGWPFSPA